MNEIRKILVRAPEKIGDQIATFATLQALVKTIDALNIDVVVSAELPYAYDYADVFVTNHKLPEQSDGPLGIFPWTHANNEIFGVDTYLDFFNAKGSSTLGIALKAKRRLGFASTLTKATYTHSFPLTEAPEFFDERGFKLLSLLFDGEMPAQIKGELPKLNDKEQLQVKALGDYIFVGIRASEWQRHQKIWQNWFDELAGGSLVIAIDQDIDDKSARDWLVKRKSEKFFVMERTFAKTDLMLMGGARGIITDSALYGNLAPYYGLEAAILAFDLNDYPSYSLLSPRQHIFLERNETVAGAIDSSGEKIEADMKSAIDQIFSKFRL